MDGMIHCCCFGRRRDAEEVLHKDLSKMSSSKASSSGGYKSGITSKTSTGVSGSTDLDYDSISSLSSTYQGAYQKSEGLVSFTLHDLKKATKNFRPSYQIGQGGFGIVYKGKLLDGSLVAIKRAKKDAFEARSTHEFHNEVTVLASVEHLNLVKLIGYVEVGEERILVEEFVRNGNLRQHLDCKYSEPLNLFTRLDISIDVAHALSYLHLYADKPIIHRDIKASNVLLTENFRAKVADFGFSRVGPMDAGKTHVSTKIKGTAGYLDPEYLRSYKLTTKSDVYSFGILLLEILTGRRPIEQNRNFEERITIRWAYDRFADGKVSEMMDPKLERTPFTEALVERVARLAFQCSAPTKDERPTMNEAAEVLWTIRKEMLQHGVPECGMKEVSSLS